MQQDQAGWGSAPEASHWHCPECGYRSPVADWGQGPGAEDSRVCPHCGWEATAGPPNPPVPVPGQPRIRHGEWGSSARISEATAAGHVERDGASFHATPRGRPCRHCHPDGIEGVAPAETGHDADWTPGGAA